MRFAARALTAALLVAAAFAAPDRLSVVVQPGDAADAIADAPAGARLVLAPGVHPGFVVDRSARIAGAPGSIVAGEIVVRAHRTRLTDLTVVGGENAITVRDAPGVVLERVTVAAADLHGIEIIGAPATIIGCRIGGLRSPYAQGIEVRMVGARPISTIAGCVISGGREGIVTHASRVEVRGNLVTGTTLRGIAITEMSEGLVDGNAVRDVAGAGLFCGDMAHCAFRNNVVHGVVADGSGARSSSGWGLVGWYYVTMQDRGSTFEATEAGAVRVTHGSLLTERFPLSTWPRGWRGAAPGVGVAAASLLALLAVRALLSVTRRARAAPASPAALPRGAAMALVWGFVVQTFHMLEHGIQVFQVHVANSSNRNGLLGAHVDAEWMHLAYNVTVMAFLVWVIVLFVPRRARAGLGWLQAAAAIQLYHVVEHVVKVSQHALGGVTPAPGLLGGRVGLVWFHFGVNLAVYAGIAAGLALIVAEVRRSVARRERSAARRVPALAGDRISVP